MMREHAMTKRYLCAMGRTVAIDFGLKRVGLAISDPLGMIANGLETVDSKELISVLHQLNSEQGFEVIVIGKPLRMSGEDSAIECGKTMLFHCRVGV